MGVLSASELLQVWEEAQRAGEDRPDPAAALLAAAFPEAPAEEPADWPLGRRDALLLRARASLFGPALHAFASCPGCQTRVEFTLDSTALIGDAAAEARPEGGALVADGYELRFRPPTGRDLAAARACGEVAQARRLLLRRCLVEARRDGAAVSAESLPETVVAQLAARLAECDPHAETVLALDCPACGHSWQAQLDVPAFVWTEISAQARRLLSEVDALARAYGWREADILAMSTARRRAYLELL